MPALIAWLAAAALAVGHVGPSAPPTAVGHWSPPAHPTAVGHWSPPAHPTAVGHWSPPAHPTWYWQLQGRIDNRVGAAVYDVDAFDTSAAEVGRLHSLGRHVVCYVDVGTGENWRSDARRCPRRLLGRSNGWPGERWLDIRALRTLEPILSARLRMCARKGFDGLEPDNIEVAGQHSGFPITPAEQLRYARWVATEAHHLGLAVFQKNDPGQSRALEPWFDGALVEQCNQYSECGAYRPYTQARKPVLNAEYARRLYPRFCTRDARAGIMGALYNLALNGRLYRPCWDTTS